MGSAWGGDAAWEEARPAPGPLHRRQLHFLLKFHDIFAKEAVGIHQVLDGLAGMDDGSMITTAKVFADGFEGILGKGFGMVHSDLPRLDDLALAGFLQ